MHRPRRPVPDVDRTSHRAIPVTSVSRTLLDLAAVLPPAALSRAVEQAEILRLFDLRATAATLERNATHRGRRGLKAAIDGYRDDVVTRSELEARLLALCAGHRIPPPAVNVAIEGHEVDFLWRAQRLVVETDGRKHHATRAAFERDRARDAKLTVAGYRVVRFTDRQLTREPDDVARTLAALLGGDPTRRHASPQPRSIISMR